MISPQMNGRLDLIRNTLKSESGPRLVFAYGIVPKFRYDNGFEKIILFGSPAGFSWIGFLFSAYFFSYIKNYKVFWLWGGLRFIAALIQVTINSEFQFSLLADIALSVLCGFWFPYNRLNAIELGLSENSIAKSIALTLILGFIACSPAALVESLALLLRG